MTKDNNRIIIIGGGLAGLTLANSLKRQGISFEVYERDESVNSRTQGWTINFHMALDAVRQSMPEGSFENFSKQVCAVPGSESISFKFINANTGDPFLSFDNNKPGTAYRVNRRKFRQWLLQPVQDHVYWNKRLIKYEESEDSVTAFFDDGTQVTGDLLVGTDGAQSPVACQLLGGRERSDELTNILKVRAFGAARTIPKELWNTISNNNPQYFCTLLGGGTLKDDVNDKVKGNTLVMFCSVQNYEENVSQVEVHWSLSRYDGENTIPKFSDDNNEECLNMLKSWACRGLPEDSLYRQLVTEAPSDTKVTPIFIRERIPTLESLVAPKRKVVLVGDAAHPMSMYKGEGGNHAMVDANNLGNEIGLYITKSKTLDDAIESYYKEMVPRGKKAVEESHKAAMAIHTQLPEVVIQMYVKIAKEAQVNFQENENNNKN